MADIKGSKPPRNETHPAVEGRWKRHQSDWTLQQRRGEGQRHLWKCVICRTIKEGRE